jgi:hypothetical protein
MRGWSAGKWIEGARGRVDASLQDSDNGGAKQKAQDSEDLTAGAQTGDADAPSISSATHNLRARIARMALSKTTKDHDEIRRWAEARGALPSEVASTQTGSEPGILRFQFPGATNANDAALKEISWEDFFEKFDANNLELLYQEETAEGEKSNFNKLIHPESEKVKRGGSGRRGASSRSGAKSSTRTTAKKSASGAKKAARSGGGKGAAKKTAAGKTGTKKSAGKSSAKSAAAGRTSAAKKTTAAKKRAGGTKTSAKAAGRRTSGKSGTAGRAGASARGTAKKAASRKAGASAKKSAARRRS